MARAKRINIIVITKEGDALPIASRMAREGHIVSSLILSPKYQSCGDGIVSKIIPKVSNVTNRYIESLIPKYQPDLIVFDSVGRGRLKDTLRTRVPVFGGDLFGDTLELNRGYGMSIMKQVGIRIPKSIVFKSEQRGKAISLAKRSSKRYVYKPSGNKDVSHTYISRGREDLIWALEEFKDDGNFILQEFVEGTEVSCEGWWSNGQLHLLNWTMEEKRFMSPNQGLTVGCMGNLVHRVEETAKLVKEGIGKMERMLKASNFRGPIDLNSIVNSDGLFGLEFTCRLGFDAFYALSEIYPGDITELFYSIAKNENPPTQLTNDFALATRLSVPPHPYRDVEAGIPIFGVSVEMSNHIWMTDMRWNSQKQRYETSGADGVIMSVSARGKTVEQAKGRVYRTIGNIHAPSLQYRVDIGDRKLPPTWIG